VKTRLTAPARRQADRINHWWRENRTAVPRLFAQELADARSMIADRPEIGSPYTERQGVLVRRVLLPKTRHHVYYEIDRKNDLVMILAIWGTPRGSGPQL
jgi:plasmid stabilization system protein ParE